MKITSGSAVRAGTSKSSTTVAGAAGAAAGGGGKAGSLWSTIANEAGGGCSARRNLNAPFTELRRTGQEAAKTELFEARAARHYARQHAGPAGRNLTDLNLPVQRANYVCSENNSFPSLLEEAERLLWLVLGLSICFSEDEKER